MYFVLERTKKILEALKEQAAVQTSALHHWECKEGLYFYPDEADASQTPYAAFDAENGRWGGFDAHCWFRLTLTVPDSFEGKPMCLTVQTEMDGWDASNPQFLAFINGDPAQGMDTNHREIFLTDRAKAGDSLRIDLQAYAGRFEEKHKLSASLTEIDPAAWALYWDLAVPVRIAEKLDKDDLTRLKIENVLTEAVNRIDLREKQSPEFRASVRDAADYLQKTLYTDLAGHNDVIATCVGHTHIDVAWHWTVAQTREKAARSFATVLKLMQEYPEYRFMSSQPQLYQFVKERYPKMYEQIRQRVREGRWEPEGGMWLESDCNLTSGESLVRQFLYGKQFFRDEFGVDNKILWLPDVFGYSAALPQIMKKAGIDYFMTTKIAWNEINKLPYDTFLWRGIDGTEIFTHLITTRDAYQDKDSFFTTYNGNLHPGALIGGWDRYQQKELNNDILVCYGWGDGGGGPTREMLENGVRLEKGLPGAPKVRLGSAREYFDGLSAKLRDNKRLPRWDGELYLEFHRGTYTSMARNKRANRLCELLYRDVEFFSVWADLLGCPYPAEELKQSWLTILLNQFHDILPGSSIKDVYEVTREEYSDLLSKARRLAEEKLDVIARSFHPAKNALLAFNTLSFSRTDAVVFDGQAEAVTDASGAPLPCQKTYDGKTVFCVRNLPAMGAALFGAEASSARADTGLSAGGAPGKDGLYTVENAYYTVKMDGSGRLTSLWDKCARREALTGTGNRLRVYEDRPMSFDNWNIDIYHKEKFWDIEDAASGEWIENGPVRAVFETASCFLHSAIRQRVIFYAHTSRIDFNTWVDWKQTQLVMKVLFPVGINANQATFDIQFGNVQRPTHYNTSWDVARFETCAHKWADLSEDGYGVGLLNNCKYGYDVHEGAMALTLIKSGNEPNPDTDQEEHRFTYALYPHEGGWREGGVAREAEMLNNPVYVREVSGEQQPDGVNSASLLRIDGGHVLLDAVKRAEDGDGIILRLHEYMNRRGDIRIVFGGDIRDAEECNLLEDPGEAIPVEQNTITFPVSPFEIKTFRIRMNPFKA